MSGLAELIESLTPEYRREALDYVQFLKEKSERVRQRIVDRLGDAQAHREAGRVYDDDEVAAWFEAKYGPLPKP